MANVTGCSPKTPPAAPAPAPAGPSAWFGVGVGTATPQLQLALLSSEQEHGLMGRRDLGPNEGMIFPADKPQRLSFWMRNTPIPLDIGYFTADGTLAEIYPMYAFDEKTVTSHSQSVQFSLEMNLGWFAANHVHPGDRLDLRALAAAIRARGFDPKSLGLSGPSSP